MLIGYARVSTDEQRLDPQLDALRDIGAERIFSDRISGSRMARPDLDRMLDQLRSGDVVIVTKYDRLAPRRPVFARQPFAIPSELDAGAVDQQAQRLP